MNMKDVDLNLFIVFDAIYSEGNLTRAGQIVGITQPAVSNALSRLRHAFGDELFVRTSQGMVPTPIAQNIITPVRKALQLLRTSIQDSEVFTPATSDKQFRISLTGLADNLLIPGMSNRLEKAAPQTAIHSYRITRREIANELAAGNIDLAVDVPFTTSPQVKSKELFVEEMVVVVRKDHPILKQPFNLEAYLELRHINVSGRRLGLSVVDLELGKRGMTRNIALRVQNNAFVPAIVKRTNLAWTTTSQYARQFDLALLPVPVQLPPQEIYLYWHESADKDPANIWMRQQLEDTCNTLVS